MADLTFTARGNVHTGNNQTSYSTAAFTPGATKLLIAIVQHSVAAAPNTPTISGHGTWTQIATYVNDTAGTQVRLTLFAIITSASPSSAAVTVDFGAQQQTACNMEVFEVGESVTSSVGAAIIQNKTGTVDTSGTSDTLTLNSALGNSANAFVGGFTHQVQEAHSASVGIIIAQGNQAGPSNCLSVLYNIGGNSGGVTWTTSATKGSIGCEVVNVTPAAAVFPRVIKNAMQAVQRAATR